MVFKVELKNNAWMAIGFGATMSNTDMIAWFVNEGEGEVQDLYSVDYKQPKADPEQNVFEERPSKYNKEEGIMTFVTRR